jgi:hypothetical protein
MWSNTHPDRLVVPVGQNGHYRLTCAAYTGTLGAFSLSIAHYSAAGVLDPVQPAGAGSTMQPAYQNNSATWTFAMAAGDYAVCSVYAAGGSTTFSHASTFFQMMRAGN